MTLMVILPTLSMLVHATNTGSEEPTEQRDFTAERNKMADRAGVVPRNVHRAHPLFEQLHRAVDLGLLLLHLDLFLLNIAV